MAQGAGQPTVQAGGHSAAFGEAFTQGSNTTAFRQEGAAAMSVVEGVTKHGEIIPVSTDLGLPGRVLRVGWDLPSNITESEWTSAGELLGKVERSVTWWIGDWWRAFKPHWGKREKFFADKGEDWDGPAYATCRLAGAVCAAFDIDRRRSDLSYAHHVEVHAMEDPDEADSLLDWASESIPRTGKPKTVRELRSEVHKRKNAVGHRPSSDTCTITDLEALVQSGKKFGCVYADPPWLYDNQGTRAATGNHYKGLTVDQLCALPVADLTADAAHLHLWTTNAFLRESFRIIDAWGFEFRSTFVWVKPEMGIGNYWRCSHEILMTAIRGDAKHFLDNSLMSWLECSRSKHSVKPEQVRSMLERASQGPYLELFARLPATGWTSWGNEIEQNLFSPNTG